MALIPKNAMLRDRRWLDHVHTLPCILTGLEGETDPAHIRWGLGGGMGLKPPDNHVLPLAHRIHIRESQMSEVGMWRNHLTNEVMMMALIALAEKMYRQWRT